MRLDLGRRVGMPFVSYLPHTTTKSSTKSASFVGTSDGVPQRERTSEGIWQTSANAKGKSRISESVPCRWFVFILLLEDPISLGDQCTIPCMYLAQRPILAIFW